MKEVQYNNKQKLNINLSTSLHSLVVIIIVLSHIHKLSNTLRKLIFKHLLHHIIVLVLQLLRDLDRDC